MIWSVLQCNGIDEIIWIRNVFSVNSRPKIGLFRGNPLCLFSSIVFHFAISFYWKCFQFQNRNQIYIRHIPIDCLWCRLCNEIVAKQLKYTKLFLTLSLSFSFGFDDGKGYKSDCTSVPSSYVCGIHFLPIYFLFAHTAHPQTRLSTCFIRVWTRVRCILT